MTEEDVFGWAEIEPDAPPEPEVVEASFEIAPAEFDLLPVKERVALFREVVELMATKAKGLVVHDQNTKAQAVSLAGQVKGKWTEIERVRNEVLAPHRTFTTSVNNLCKGFQEPLKQIENLLKKKITEQDNRERIELARQQAEAEKAAKALEAEAKAQADMFGTTPPVIIAPVLPETPGPTRTEDGTASTTKRWVCVIINEHDVPREYCVPDQRLLNQAVRAGIRNIAGCEIKEEHSTKIRR